MANRISNARRPGGLNKYGAPVGLGQQRKGSPFLDQPQAEPEPEPARFTRPAYNANEATERRGSEFDDFREEERRESEYEAPVSAPKRLNPALDSAISGNSAHRVRQDFVREQSAPSASGIESLYGSARAPRSSPTDPQSLYGNNRAVPRYGPDPYASAEPEPEPEGANDPLSQLLGPQAGMPQGSMWSQDYRFQGGEGLPDVMNLQYGDPSRMSGFATHEWGAGGDPNYDEDSIKNTFGKLASNIDPRQAGAREQLMASEQFKQLFPNAQAVSFDKIDFGDGNPVDVMLRANAQTGAGDQWWFGTDAGGGTSGDLSGLGGAGDAQSAYAQVAGLDPNMPIDQLESALTSAFAKVPGFEQAYKESVKINGVWYDLIGGYGGPNAKFHGLMPKVEHGSMGAGISAPGMNDLGQNISSDQFMLPASGEENFSEEIRKLISSGQLEGLDQAILGPSAPRARPKEFIDENEDGTDDRDQPYLFANSPKLRRSA